MVLWTVMVGYGLYVGWNCCCCLGRGLLSKQILYYQWDTPDGYTKKLDSCVASRGVMRSCDLDIKPGPYKLLFMTCGR